jgi:hypothetical protein
MQAWQRRLALFPRHISIHPAPGCLGRLDACGALDAGQVDIFLPDACPGWADRGLQLFFCNTSLHAEAGTLTEGRVDGVTSRKIGGGDGSLLPDLRFGGVAEED